MLSRSFFIIPRRLSLKAGIILFLITFFAAKNSFSQNKELKIGYKVPDVALTMMNYPKEKILLSEFKGKAIILDFWATWCAPCVNSFPKMDSLQQEFSNELQILPVSYEAKTTIQLLFAKMNMANKLAPPLTVINDRELAKLFPHTGLPHYVWIAKDGIVKAITDASQITSKNIRSFLHPANFSLPEKKDISYSVNKSNPVFLGDKQVELLPQEILFQKNQPYVSVLTGFRPEIQAGCFYDSNRIIRANGSIKGLFRDAYCQRKPELLSDNRIVLNVRDSSLVDFNVQPRNPDSFKRWRLDHVYCYEVIVPFFDKDSKVTLKYMQDDLNNYFSFLGISGKLEVMNRKCYVLKKVPSIIPLKSGGGNPTKLNNTFFYKLTNLPLNTLLNDLKAYYWQLSPLPVIDESGYGAQLVDIEINAKMSSVAEVGKALAKYGLVLTEESRDMEMIVITQK